MVWMSGGLPVGIFEGLSCQFVWNVVDGRFSLRVAPVLLCVLLRVAPL